MTLEKVSIWACVFFLFVYLLHGSSANAASLYDTKYDFDFEKYTEMYMPIVDWRILKAQCFAESSFRESVVSPVGAQGLCQFMPATWTEVSTLLGIEGSPFDTTVNIQFAAFYMKRQRAKWTSPRPEFDRHSLAMASYNAGFGNIYSAQKRCDLSPFYDKIIVCLPAVTGEHSKETIGYVDKIWNYYLRMLFF
jgi:membrane-bound lytic murein transglycosylase F